MSCYQQSILKTNIREEVYLCCKLAYNFMAFALSKDVYNMAHRTGYLFYNSSVLQLLKLIAVLQLRNKNEWVFSATLKFALKCYSYIYSKCLVFSCPEKPLAVPKGIGMGPEGIV